LKGSDRDPRCCLGLCPEKERGGGQRRKKEMKRKRTKRKRETKKRRKREKGNKVPNAITTLFLQT